MFSVRRGIGREERVRKRLLAGWQFAGLDGSGRNENLGWHASGSVGGRMKAVKTRPGVSSIADRATASLLRETYLEPFTNEDPFVCDLNGIRSLSVDAADELIAKFVERLRARREHAVVFVIARAREVIGNTHAALRDRGQAVWAAVIEEGAEPILIPVGDLEKTERDALEVLYAQGGHVDGVSEPLATLVAKGLVLKTAAGYQLPGLPPDAIEQAAREETREVAVV